MHFALSISTLIFAFMASVSAFPSQRRTITRRAEYTDVCEVGYCTLNGGTTGGSSGDTVTVTSIDELSGAVSADGASIIIVDGSLEGSDTMRVSSDKTIIGTYGSSITGVGFLVKDVSNVILRNLAISKVLADNGDAITIQAASNVWVDHCDLSSDMDNGKDYYDGLLDITHASEYVTVSNTFLHDHYKASLVGHSDNNGDEDEGHLLVTYANNYWYNINSRGPSVRFGTAHILNSYYLACNGAINTRMGAEVLVESTQFEDCGDEVIESKDSDEEGYAVVNDVDLGDSENTASTGSITEDDLGYSYTLVGSDVARDTVYGTAGNTLTF
ncbi:hypothetical protein MKZ38_010606 [Zalerion maritima]|uniref:pectate lyase n=1 Tax=Zalerion maritima TaxID=339359 RepID=A0AAD5RS60_9PEZI|nr:hypothetical protein MKZ38_010606 [Zalerion maritima]